MKVLFGVAGDFHYLPSGEVIQVLKTKEYLERLGIGVEIVDASSAEVRSCDVVHLFNLNKASEICPLAELAERANIPTVLSPIYWNLDEFESKVLVKALLKRRVLHLIVRSAERSAFVRRIVQGILSKQLKRARYGPLYREQQQQCLEMMQMVLPNGYGEWHSLKRDLRTNGKYRIVPNAVDTQIDPPDAAFLRKKYRLPDEFILCAARIEYRKNQLGLIDALRNLGMPLVLAGQINPAEKSYWGKCLHVGNGFVQHLGHLPQHEVYGIMRLAKVHAVPSWFETPGLSNLEAAFNCCQVVTTERGTAKEYFGDMVNYCNPDDPDSIRDAVLHALTEPKDAARLKEHILRHYTWEKAAEATLEAYHQVLSDSTKTSS